MMLARKTLNGKLLRICFAVLLMSALIRPVWAQQGSGKLPGRVFGPDHDEHQLVGGRGFGLLQKTWP